MAPLRAFPALKAGTLDAAIFIFSPVRGFLPSLALRSLTENVPKLIILTSSSPLSASVTTRSKAPKCLWASPSGTPASSAILSMSSVLFISAPFSGRMCLSGGYRLVQPRVCTGGAATSQPGFPDGFRETDPVGGLLRGIHHIWHKRFGTRHEGQRPCAANAGAQPDR